MLAQKLFEEGAAFASSWNFGPNPDDAKTVRWIVESIASTWASPAVWEVDEGEHPHEAQMLQLDWSKAAQQLEWHPALRLAEALSITTEWYQHFLSGRNAGEKCLEQISAYCAKVEGQIPHALLSPKRRRELVNQRQGKSDEVTCR